MITRNDSFPAARPQPCQNAGCSLLLQLTHNTTRNTKHLTALGTERTRSFADRETRWKNLWTHIMNKELEFKIEVTYKNEMHFLLHKACFINNHFNLTHFTFNKITVYMFRSLHRRQDIFFRSFLFLFFSLYKQIMYIWSRIKARHVLRFTFHVPRSRFHVPRSNTVKNAVKLFQKETQTRAMIYDGFAASVGLRSLIWSFSVVGCVRYSKSPKVTASPPKRTDNVYKWGCIIWGWNVNGKCHWILVDSSAQLWYLNECIRFKILTRRFPSFFWFSMNN